jgi:hypothetical protein
MMRLSINRALVLLKVFDRGLAWNAFHCLVGIISVGLLDARA